MQIANPQVSPTIHAAVWHLNVFRSELSVAKCAVVLQTTRVLVASGRVKKEWHFSRERASFGSRNGFPLRPLRQWITFTHLGHLPVHCDGPRRTTHERTHVCAKDTRPSEKSKRKMHQCERTHMFLPVLYNRGFVHTDTHQAVGMRL